MNAYEKKLYKFIYKAIKEGIRSELNSSEDRIVERILSEITIKDTAVGETMKSARQAIRQGVNVHNGTDARQQKPIGNILNELISSTRPLSEQGSITSNLNESSDIHTIPPKQSTGNVALDTAMAAPFKDYSAFMKKVDERNKTRKG